MRALLLLGIVLGSVSCGVEPAENTTGAVASRADALVLPSAPTEFSQYRGPLFAPGLGSAYVVAIQDPRNPADFLAWGFDVKKSAAVFFVHGNLRLEWLSFNNKLAVDLSTFIAGSAFDPAFMHGMVVQVNKPPKGPAPGGGDWRAFSRNAYDAVAVVAAVIPQSAL